VQDELLTVLHGEVKVLGAWLDLGLTVASVVSKGFSPSMLLEDLINQEDGTSSDQRIFVLEHTVFQKDSFNQVTSEEIGLLLDFSDLGVSIQELETGTMGQFHLQDAQDVSFHFQNLCACVSLVANSDEFLQAWWVDFFVLASNEQRGDSDELELMSSDSSLAQISVNKVNGHE
jgi:hypothetical protein